MAAAVGLLGLALLAVVVWQLPILLTSHPNRGVSPADRLKAVNDARTPLVTALGVLGGAVISSVFIANRDRRTAETQRLAEQGQITDRYTKAVEQLGSTSIWLRIGGVYALERIALDSPRDQTTIVEVLSAFVRVPREQPVTLTKESEARLATDVHAAFTVLGRLPMRYGVPRAYLDRAYLSGARVDRANLSGARLVEANLSDARLVEANLSEAWLGEANLSGADLRRANLSAADLRRANLSAARLVEANLSDARLVEAYLSGADLRRADLSGADLGEANLFGVDLREANLSAARLDRTNGLRPDQLESARGDIRTQLPEGLEHPLNWGDK